MKKFLFSIICTLLPLAASAQEPYAILIDNGTALEFRYDDQKSAYPDAMSVRPFNSLEDRPWQNVHETIRSIVFDQSFANCTSITSTALWFTLFGNLETIIGLEYLNTSNVTDMGSMFSFCYYLTNLDLSHFNTENVTNMSQMFYMCTSLANVDLGNFNTRNVTDMWGMFWYCTSLTNIDVKHFNTSNVTNMNQMFWYCSGLTSLDLSNFNTLNVTDMSNMFAYCSNLKTIYSGENWNTSNVIEGTSMFVGCESLIGGAGTTYDANHVDHTYAHIDGGSSNPGYLTGASSSQEESYWVELRSTLDWGADVLSRARNFSGIDPWMVEELEMFLGRGNEMYNEHTAGEEEVRHMIEELNWIIREVEEAMNRPVDSDPEPYAVLSDNNTVLTFYYDGDKEARGGMSVGPFSDYQGQDKDVHSTSEWDSARSSITTVVFDATFANCTSITSTGDWFLGFSNLTSITGIENLNTSNTTVMSGMFSGCTSLTSLDVSHFNTANVELMTNMFYHCSSLTSLDVSSFNTSKVTDMAVMFCGCSSLANLDVSHFNTAYVTTMSLMFANCSSLRTIYAGENWTTSRVTEGTDMFLGCRSLVGGRGTEYNSDHIDYTYAHIDGGANNPGYLTDINGSGTSDLNQRRAELLDMINQLAARVNVCAYELSRKDPQRSSELWDNLADIEVAIMNVKERTERAESDAELDECEARIRQIAAQLDWLDMQIAEYSEGDASFDGLTARVSGSATLDDAFASVGGRSEAAKTIAAIIWNGDGALTADMLQGIDNPNLLVYVTEASKAPSGVQNVVINGTAAEIVLTDASGNNNFYCPQSFTAQSISYTRNFSQTTQIDVCQGWETISLPFAVQSIRHQTHGALTPFGGGNNGYPFWLRQLSSGGLSRATAIEANRPYLICMPNNTVYPSVYNQAGNITFSATNVTVPVTTEQTASGAGVTLRPAFQQVAQSNSVYALNVGEARGNNPEGSVFEQNYRAIRPFQAYTTHSSGTRFITLQSLGLGGDDTTGIETIDTEEADDSNATWHTLDGRRLEGKPTKKGVYIKDGRKYIIK